MLCSLIEYQYSQMSLCIRKGRAPNLCQVLQVPLQLWPHPHLCQAGRLWHTGCHNDHNGDLQHAVAEDGRDGWINGDNLFQLLVKKAFFALVYNGVRAAPLWDSVKQRYFLPHIDAPWSLTTTIQYKEVKNSYHLKNALYWRSCPSHCPLTLGGFWMTTNICIFWNVTEICSKVPVTGLWECWRSQTSSGSCKWTTSRPPSRWRS